MAYRFTFDLTDIPQALFQEIELLINKKQTKKQIKLHSKRFVEKYNIDTITGLSNSDARIGIILPASVHNDSGSQELRKHFLPWLELLVKFDNEKRIFKGLEHNSKFDVIIINKARKLSGFLGAFLTWSDESPLNDIVKYSIFLENYFIFGRFLNKI